MTYSFIWNIIGLTSAAGVSYRNRRDVQANSARTCATNDQESTLLFDRCWFCACEPCQIDLLFLVDQSSNAESQCSNVVAQFDVVDQVVGEQVAGEVIVHEGAKEQIDFVIDAIENIPTDKLQNEFIRIAVALYGNQDQIEEIVGFGDTNVEDIKCRLYGYAGTENCDMNVFVRKALCGQTGVYQAMKWAAGYDIFADFDTADYQWRKWVDGDTSKTPVTRMMVVTAADQIYSEAIDQELLMNDLRLLHDPHQRGFDTIYTVGMPKAEGERDTEAEVQYWRDLNQIGCLNPEACDNTIMYDPREVDDMYVAVDGGEFMLQLLSDDSAIMNPFFCYFSRWNYFCEIAPVIRLTRSEEDEEMPTQLPYWNIKPNACCGSRPYHDSVQECCDPIRGQVRIDCDSSNENL